MRDKCFDKCITKPSSSLSSSEQQCLARCCDRYAEVSSAVPACLLAAAMCVTVPYLLAACSCSWGSASLAAPMYKLAGWPGKGFFGSFPSRGRLAAPACQAWH